MIKRVLTILAAYLLEAILRFEKGTKPQESFKYSIGNYGVRGRVETGPNLLADATFPLKFSFFLLVFTFLYGSSYVCSRKRGFSSRN